MTARNWLAVALLIGFTAVVVGQEQFRRVAPGDRPQTIEPPLADDVPRNLPKLDIPGDGKDEPIIPAAVLPTKEPPTIIPAQAIGTLPQSAPAPALLATPVMTISVIGSDTAAEGNDIKYTLLVQNRSEAKAHHVLVRCPVPKNATFVKASTDPKVEAVGEGSELHWQLGTVSPNESKSIDLFFKPNPGETEIRVLGRVQFDHGRWLATRIAKPGLSVRKLAPAEGVLYEAITYRIEVTNPGKIPVTDIKVEDAMDEGLEFERQANAVIDLEKNLRTWTVGTLAAGEKKVLEYSVIAKKAGPKKSLTRVTGTGMASVEQPHTLSVVEARLELKVTPAVDASVTQPAALQIFVNNKGTATLNNVRVTCGHPADLEVKRSAAGAQFFKETVQWVLPKLAAGESRTLSVQFVAKTPGKRKFAVTVKGDRGGEQKEDASIDFEGIASLNWKTDGTPVATVGKDVLYTVEVWNPGTATATNVILQAKLPPEVQLKTANPLYNEGSGMIQFKPIAVPPKTKATFAITCVAKKKGVAAFQFDLLADHLKKTGSQQNQVATTINADGSEPAPMRPDRIGTAPENLQLKEPEKSIPKLDAKKDTVKEKEKEKEKEKSDLVLPAIPPP